MTPNRHECGNCHHFHPDDSNHPPQYLYGSGMCHLKTEFHKYPKRESVTNWCTYHKPRTDATTATNQDHTK